MLILNEGYGYILIFKDELDLKNTIEELKTELKEIERDRTKPPFLLSFYTDTGVTKEYVKTHLADLKKRFKYA